MRIFSIYKKAKSEPTHVHGSALGFWKLDLFHENPKIVTDF